MGERGQALIESIVAAAVALVIVGAVLGGAIVASAHFGPDPAQSALSAAVGREMAVARNLVKYQGATLRAASLQTTVPLPDGSPLPATLQLQTAPLPNGGVQLTISASAIWRNATRTFSLTGSVLAPAPLPGSSLALPGLAPAPTGAP
ncbi:MAG TPA: hypothetical protein VIN40_05940 [Candidatus Tyrphobacter sp.]